MATMRENFFLCFVVVSSLIAVDNVVQGKAVERPKVTISVKDGVFDGIGSGLDPSVTWGGQTTLGNKGDVASCDVEYGVELDGSVLSGDGVDQTNVLSAAKSIWGKASKTYKDWLVTLRGELKRGGDETSFQLTADAPRDYDFGFKLWADASKSIDSLVVTKVEAMKGIDLDDSTRLVLKPRYYVQAQEGDVVVAFAKDDTVVEVIASKDDQQITVSQQVDGQNRVVPTFTRSGAMSLEWERTLSEDNSLTTKFTPNDSIAFKWKDSQWTATMTVPIISGFQLGGPTVNIQRDVSF